MKNHGSAILTLGAAAIDVWVRGTEDKPARVAGRAAQVARRVLHPAAPTARAAATGRELEARELVAPAWVAPASAAPASAAPASAAPAGAVWAAVSAGRGAFPTRPDVALPIRR